MRIYVAGRTTEADRVNKVQKMFTDRGHTITYDWTVNVKETEADPELYTVAYARYCAERDWDGVVSADVVVALMADGLLGTAIEIGMAIQTGVPVVLVGDVPRECVFFELPTVFRCHTDKAARPVAEQAYGRAREQALSE